MMSCNKFLQVATFQLVKDYVKLFLFSDPPIYKLLTGDLYHWVMYEYHYLLTMVGMTTQGWYNQ